MITGLNATRLALQAIFSKFIFMINYSHVIDHCSKSHIFIDNFQIPLITLNNQIFNIS